MARLTKMSRSPAPFRDDDIYNASPPPSGQRTSNNAQQDLSHSPATSVSSDKENRSSRPAVDKGKGRAPMRPPARLSTTSNRKKRRAADEPLSDRSNSRRRTVEADDDDGDDVHYDPDQDPKERRELRDNMRTLDKTVRENRAEYLNPNSTGLRDTLIEANRLSAQVKQTSDATIDSKLLATVADFVQKKTVALISGDTAQGVDIDEFILRTRAFMRRGDAAANAPSSTQRHREDEGEEDGEMLNWAYLGQNACIMHNVRPSVPGFLLGPLSLEKRARRVVVRKAALKHSTLRETRPETLKIDDVQKNENANLAGLCTEIAARLTHVRNKAMAKVDELATDGMTREETDALMDRFNISQSGGYALFQFIINPYSFGQTIENMFYVSFLVRDSKVGISTDLRGLPYLDLISEEDALEAKRLERSRHQAVLSMDMDLWSELIEVFDIKEPMIRHREEDDNSNVGAKGWYA